MLVLAGSKQRADASQPPCLASQLNEPTQQTHTDTHTFAFRSRTRPELGEREGEAKRERERQREREREGEQYTVMHMAASL